MLKTTMHLDDEFENLYNVINRSDIGKELLNLTGIGREQLDVGHLSHAYFQEHWDETSTDPNANANNMGPINYGLEISKPQLKLIGLYLLHRYARKDFSIEYADRLLKNLVKGDYYFHDASGVGIQQAYCYAFSTQWVMNNGIPWGQLKSLPPKKAASYIAQVVETTMEMSMEYAGAIAPADVLVHYAHYSKKEALSHKEIENHLQSLVHIFNKQFRPGGQSPFTNISIFDRPNLESLFGHIFYEDGSSPDYDEIMRVQRIFLNWFCKGDPSTGLPYRFPIVTVNFALGPDKEILDNYFLSEIAAYDTKLGCLNIHSGTHGKLAMCPLHPDEEVLIRNHKGIFKSRIGNLGQWDKEIYEVMINGEFKKGKFLQTKTTSFVEITLSNGHQIKTTPEHLNLTRRGTKSSKDLEVGDLLPFSLVPYQGEGGTYEAGYMVGAYMGDGSITNGTVNFSLNPGKKKMVYDRLKDYMNNILGAKTFSEDKGNVLMLNTRSKTVIGMIKQFVSGDRSTNKGIISEVYEKSLAFRQGVYDGYFDTDGGTKGRIYTASETMKSDLSTLVSTLGSVTNIAFVDQREGRYGTNPVYFVKRYKPEGLRKRGYSGMWEKDPEGDDKAWFYITKISHQNHPNMNAYCFEMETDEHLFQLANGLITHNCRFINDPERMRQFKTDTFGNGGLNIGSHRVIALGLPRIAYEAKGNWKKYMEILGRRMEEVRDLLVIHRERILGKRIEQNFLKSFQYGLAHPSHFFSTFGFVGLYEAVSAMGLDVSSEEGFNRAKEITMFMDLLAAEYSKELGYAFNTEEIPAEGAAVTLCRKDKILFPDDVKVDMYSNQFFPLHLATPLLERISKTGELMEGVSGGSILHINIDEKIENPDIMETLMRKIIKEGVNHFGINYGFSICPKDPGHNSAGIHQECPICGETIEDWMTRVVGYFVPVSKWNPTRREVDFKGRQWYKEV